MVRAAHAPSGRAFVPQDAATGRVQLKPAQQRVLDALPAGADLTRAQYEELAGVSRSQAAYDLAELVEAGILHRVGAGRATRYRLAREGGGQRHWTSDRIRAELEAFCDGRQSWPSAAEFKDAGRGDLYVAASRYGGIAHWAEALGHPRPGRVATAKPGPPAPRRKLTWAAAGALAAIGLLAGGGAVVLGLSGASEPTAKPSPAGSRAASTVRVIDESTHPRRAGLTLGATQKAPVRRAQRHVAKRRTPAPRHTPARSGTSLITYSSSARSTYVPGTTSSAPQHSMTPAPSSSGANGPLPLAAPPPGGVPQPIPPPGK
jgi:Transcriptional regulator DIP2311-like, C-terminal domain